MTGRMDTASGHGTQASTTPCFTPGTLIATPEGQRPVEALRPGDRVLTRDNGFRQIAWAGARHLDAATLAAHPDLRPVLIRRGSLGNGLPLRDMMVSPNHRVLLCDAGARSQFGEAEVLAPAKSLANGKGIARVQTGGVSYIHFMFDQHEIVLSDGAWTESFQPAAPALDGLARAQRREILALFPDLATEPTGEGFAPARKPLSADETRLALSG